MLLWNAQQNNRNSQGFTLIEVLATVIIVGILSAIAAPSFLALFSKNKVDDALNQVRGALQEAQRETIRTSKSCSVTLDTTNNKITGPCLVTGDRNLAGDGVAMKTNVNSGSPSQITFSIRGNTTFSVASSVTPPATPTDSSGKIILYESDGSTPDKKCVAISNGIGIIRAGNYNGPIDTAANITDQGTCNASQY